LCGWFKRLGNCFFAVKVLAAVTAGVAMCLALSLADGLVCSAWGMLFVAMAEGRL
jgi:hypothetical protein